MLSSIILLKETIDPRRSPEANTAVVHLEPLEPYLPEPVDSVRQSTGESTDKSKKGAM